MAAKLTRSLSFDPSSSTLKVDATAYVSPYTDPVTHVPARNFYYNASLDLQVVKSGTSGGTATISFFKVLGQGLHSLDLFAGNSTSGERISSGVDIHNYTQATSGQTIFGEDDAIGSTRVDYAYGSQYGDAFIMGQNDDYVEAYGGNDYIDGGTGADTMIGGAGVDWYRVDNAGDKVIELAGQGNDRVLSTISYTLGANVEELELTGDGQIDGTGNELANLMIGNDRNNILTGNAGNDTLEGGAGLDKLNGGAGDDILDGGTFADTMEGGTGNDIYVVDNARDVVTEAASAGTDTVKSSINYILGVNVENLTLTGTIQTQGVGNELANEIYGSDVNNLIRGLGGNDQLWGQAGNDVLQGGEGADRLNGGLGQDNLFGGAGDDVFDFRSVAESPYGSSNADQISDWAKGDRIDVSAIDANTNMAGNQAFVFDTDGVFSAGEIRQQIAGNITILSFNTGGDETPEMMIMVKGQQTFTSGDFWL